MEDSNYPNSYLSHFKFTLPSGTTITFAEALRSPDVEDYQEFIFGLASILKYLDPASRLADLSRRAQRIVDRVNAETHAALSFYVPLDLRATLDSVCYDPTRHDCVARRVYRHGGTQALLIELFCERLDLNWLAHVDRLSDLELRVLARLFCTFQLHADIPIWIARYEALTPRQEEGREARELQSAVRDTNPAETHSPRENSPNSSSSERTIVIAPRPAAALRPAGLVRRRTISDTTSLNIARPVSTTNVRRSAGDLKPRAGSSNTIPSTSVASSENFSDTTISQTPELITSNLPRTTERISPTAAETNSRIPSPSAISVSSSSGSSESESSSINIISRQRKRAHSQEEHHRELISAYKAIGGGLVLEMEEATSVTVSGQNLVSDYACYWQYLAQDTVDLRLTLREGEICVVRNGQNVRVVRENRAGGPE